MKMAESIAHSVSRLKVERDLIELGLQLRKRDEIIKAAHMGGSTKNRIHVVTGLARTTIDRILNEQS